MAPSTKQNDRTTKSELQLKQKAGVEDYESGQVTVLMAGIIAACLILIMTFVSLGAAASGKAQAQSAADFAALAAAKAKFYGSDSDPCALAGEIAERNSAVLVDCALEEVAVRVKVEKNIWVPARLWTAKAQARAGPVR